MDVGTFEAAGLYDPEAPTAADRLTVLRFLEERGATLEQMVAADADGRLPALSADLAAFGSVERISVAEVAQRSGTSAARIRRMVLAQGLPVDDRTLLPVFAVDDAVAFDLGMSLFGDEATLAFTRVMGAAASRIVDAAISLFYAEVSPRLATELETVVANDRAGAVFALLPEVVGHLLEQCFRQDSVRSTSRLGGGGQTATVGIGFVDLVGSTQWARGLSLKDHALALARFESAAWDIATEYGGRVVKLIGDEAMIVSASAETTSRIALALCAAVTAEATLPGAPAVSASVRSPPAAVTTSALWSIWWPGPSKWPPRGRWW